MGSKCHESCYLPGDNTGFSYLLDCFCVVWGFLGLVFFYVQCLSNQTIANGVLFHQCGFIKYRW